MKLKSLFDCERLSLKQKPHWFKKTNKQKQYSFSPSNDILGIGLIRSVGPQKWLRSSPCCSFNSDNLMRKSYIFIIDPIFATVEIVRRCRRLAAVIAVEEQRERDDTGSRKMAESCCLSHFVFFVVFPHTFLDSSHSAQTQALALFLHIHFPRKYALARSWLEVSLIIHSCFFCLLTRRTRSTWPQAVRPRRLLYGLLRQRSVQLQQRDSYCSIKQKRKARVQSIFRSVNMCTSAYFRVGVWLDIRLRDRAACQQPRVQVSLPEVWNQPGKHRDRQERGAG